MEAIEEDSQLTDMQVGDFNSFIVKKGMNTKKGRTKDFIETMADEVELSNTHNSTYLTTRGNNGGTWMHPYLFIDFAHLAHVRKGTPFPSPQRCNPHNPLLDMS